MTGPATPAVVSRAGWGADELLGLDAAGHERWPRAIWPLQKLIVHHTAWPERIDDPASAVRSIHRMHAADRGWGDIGYGYLIAADGTIYEGRAAPLTGPAHAPAGAHAIDHNAGSLGIALLGDLTASEPTPAARESLIALLAHEAARASIDPTGAGPYVNPVTGRRSRFPNIAAHRDIADTECPGGGLNDVLPAIRASVRALAPAS